MEYIIKNKVLKSRRGNYNTVSLITNPVIWTPKTLNTDVPRHKDVIAEIEFAMSGILSEHKYWQNEPLYWIQEYQKFYTELFLLQWLHEKADRHNIVANTNCCLTLVQYHDGVLTAYSRSTDMRNGYFSDRLVLNYLAECINKSRPDCQVEQIVWYLAIPHVYEQEGVARLIKTDEVTE